MSDDTPAAGSYRVRRTHVAEGALLGSGFSEGFAVSDSSGATVWSFGYRMHLGSQEWKVVDGSGAQVADLHHGAHVHPQFELSGQGRPTVTIRKASFAPMHESWKVEGAAGGDLDVKGSWTDHDFAMTDSSGAVRAQVSRAWASVHDTFDVAVSGTDALTAVAAAVAIDATEHER